jgi:hypothetical protein
VSTHWLKPLEHEVVPKWQGVDGVHEMPGWQKLQLPLAQTWLGPHEVPLATGPVAMHCCVPDAQEVNPCMQGLLVAQGSASVHGVPQTPLVHTRSEPHEVPFGCAPALWHTGEPVEHEILPFWHGSDAWQLPPGLHANTHDPCRQTCPAPQAIPSGAGPDGVQSGEPPSQVIRPIWQASPTMQLPPGAHVLTPSQWSIATCAAKSSLSWT